MYISAHALLCCKTTKYCRVPQTPESGHSFPRFMNLHFILSLAFDSCMTRLNLMGSCLEHCGDRRGLIASCIPLLFPSPFSLCVVINRETQFKSWNIDYESWLGSNQITCCLIRAHWLPPARQGAEVTQLSNMGGPLCGHNEDCSALTYSLGQVALNASPNSKTLETELHEGFNPPPAYRTDSSLGMKWLVSSAQ